MEKRGGGGGGGKGGGGGRGGKGGGGVVEEGISDSSDDEESNAEMKRTFNNTNEKGVNVKTPASRDKEKKGAKFSDDTKGTSDGRTAKKRTKRSWGGKPKADHQ